jgi:hypothetical protein
VVKRQSRQNRIQSRGLRRPPAYQASLVKRGRPIIGHSLAPRRFIERRTGDLPFECPRSCFPPAGRTVLPPQDSSNRLEKRLEAT